ncbi:MAG: phosphoribosyl-AMP cyclohydrolase [Planctomycetota bacterium]|nr:phosphoribosyl-AMP cyclohydrolase [Planctomycetota bacterium]
MGKLDETIQALKYDAAGLIPAVCVDAETRAVLMVAYMNETALRETLRTGKTHFFSRSRRKIWMKGESSGHSQDVKAIYTDCDADTLLIEVAPHGPACHEGYASCFYRRLNAADGGWDVIAQKLFDPKDVYGSK